MTEREAKELGELEANYDRVALCSKTKTATRMRSPRPNKNSW